MRPGITVVIPSIGAAGGREEVLAAAVASVQAQTVPARDLWLYGDVAHEGPIATRNAGLRCVDTEWTAFLDDDDVMYPNHLATLLDGARGRGADYVFSYFDIIDEHGRVTGGDPLGNFGRPFDPASPHQTTITVLVRTELAQQVGFRAPQGEQIEGQRWGEDFQFTVDCVAAGASVVHVPRRTWGYRHWGYGVRGRAGNTSGDPTRW